MALFRSAKVTHWAGTRAQAATASTGNHGSRRATRLEKHPSRLPRPMGHGGDEREGKDDDQLTKENTNGQVMISHPPAPSHMRGRRRRLLRAYGIDV